MRSTQSPVSKITYTEPASIISEAFRSVRTFVTFASFEKGQKVIMVTSSVPEEGKTTIVSNLGILTAQDGKRTLLVDSDLRRPHLHHIFSVSNRNGLSTLLTGYSDPIEAVQQTEIPSLSILPAGPIQPQPSELLGLNRFEKVIERFRGRYDAIIIDTPPILTATDSALIARTVDSIALVVRAMNTKREQVLKAQKHLQPFKEKVIGIVLNNRVDD